LRVANHRRFNGFKGDLLTDSKDSICSRTDTKVFCSASSGDTFLARIGHARYESAHLQSEINAVKIFVSSTYIDLAEHRSAVNEVLVRMKSQFAAMEYFGSRGEEASAACFAEIDECNVLVGVYAWRYGWQPTQSEPSITEQEFDYGRSTGKTCLCYVVDEDFPWPPRHMDRGEPASRLADFKAKVGRLVRSKFTTPDNLAKQVAADLARLVSTAPPDSFGGLVRVNWDVFSPELKIVLSTAYSQARADSRSGVVATRHVIAAMAGLPNTGRAVVTAFPKVEIPELDAGIRKPDLAEMYFYDRPVSSCVLGSMNRLLPRHSASEQLLAIELAADLLKNGEGESVAKFRKAGVDGSAVSQVEKHIRQIAANSRYLEQGLQELSDAEIIHLAYITTLPLPTGLTRASLRDHVLHLTQKHGVALLLAGELLRRHPKLVGLN
jgi:hypothetical protein